MTSCLSHIVFFTSLDVQDSRLLFQRKISKGRSECLHVAVPAGYKIHDIHTALTNIKRTTYKKS